MSRLSLALFAGLTLLSSVAAADGAPLTRTKVTTATPSVPRAPRSGRDTAELTVIAQIDVARPAHRMEGARYDAFSADKSPRYLLLAAPVPRPNVVP